MKNKGILLFLLFLSSLIYAQNLIPDRIAYTNQSGKLITDDLKAKSLFEGTTSEGDTTHSWKGNSDAGECYIKFGFDTEVTLNEFELFLFDGIERTYSYRISHAYSWDGTYFPDSTDILVSQKVGTSRTIIDSRTARFFRVDIEGIDSPYVELFDIYVRNRSRSTYRVEIPYSGTTCTINGNEKGIVWTPFPADPFLDHAWQYPKKIDLYRNGLFKMNIIESTYDDGSESWLPPNDLQSDDRYQIKITDIKRNGGSIISDYFRIYNPNNTATPTPAPTATPLINPNGMGDANGDGEISSADTDLIVKYYMNNNINIDYEKANVNCDDVIDLNDALMVAQFIEGTRKTLELCNPKPYNVCFQSNSATYVDNQRFYTEVNLEIGDFPIGVYHLNINYNPDLITPDLSFGENGVLGDDIVAVNMESPGRLSVAAFNLHSDIYSGNLFTCKWIANNNAEGEGDITLDEINICNSIYKYIDLPNQTKKISIVDATHQIILESPKTDLTVGDTFNSTLSWELDQNYKIRDFSIKIVYDKDQMIPKNIHSLVPGHSETIQISNSIETGSIQITVAPRVITSYIPILGIPILTTITPEAFGSGNVLGITWQALKPGKGSISIEDYSLYRTYKLNSSTVIHAPLLRNNIEIIAAEYTINSAAKPANIEFDLELPSPAKWDNTITHWIPNNQEPMEAFQIKVKAQRDIGDGTIDGEFEFKEDYQYVEILSPLDASYVEPEEGSSNIYMNRGSAAIEIYACDENGNFDSDQLLKSYFLNPAITNSKARYTQNENNTGQNLRIDSEGYLYFNNGTEESKYFTVKLGRDGIARPGDDILLRFQLLNYPEYSDTVSEGDFLAVYDKEMLDRANMYIDERINHNSGDVIANAVDWNGDNQIDISPWTRWNDNASVYGTVAYSYAGCDTVQHFNQDLEDQIETIRAWYSNTNSYWTDDNPNQHPEWGYGGLNEWNTTFAPGGIWGLAETNNTHNYRFGIRPSTTEGASANAYDPMSLKIKNPDDPDDDIISTFNPYVPGLGAKKFGPADQGGEGIQNQVELAIYSRYGAGIDCTGLVQRSASYPGNPYTLIENPDARLEWGVT